MLIGVETNPYRIELAKKMGLADYVFAPDEAYDQIMKVTNGNGVERAFDASASDPGRQLAIRATREWGRIAFVGEGCRSKSANTFFRRFSALSNL